MNVEPHYENVKPGDLLFEQTVYTGEELLIIGKAPFRCGAPQPVTGRSTGFEISGKKIVNPTIYKTASCFGFPNKQYPFPETDLTNQRASQAQTSMGKLLLLLRSILNFPQNS